MDSISFSVPYVAEFLKMRVDNKEHKKYCFSYFPLIGNEVEKSEERYVFFYFLWNLHLQPIFLFL